MFGDDRIKFLVKCFCLLVSLTLLAAVCGCGSNSGGDAVDVDPDDFDMSGVNGKGESTSTENTDDEVSGTDGSGDASGTEDGNAASKNETNPDPVSSDHSAQSADPAYDYEEDVFKPMQIPSRKNAYKLSNVFDKMSKGQAVTVAYFGGSVTNGSGAGKDSTCWRSITTEYLKQRSSGTVKEINVSIGGTGSYFGAARFQHDIIANDPDLVFIEFAINDVYSGMTEEQSKANLEYMIRSLYAKNPDADIVMALVTNKSNFGRQYKSYLAHKAVADHYGIPIVDLGGEAYNKLNGSLSEFTRHFEDSVHPNDTGHRLYADIMIAALKELLAGSKSAHKMPAARLSKIGYTSLTNIFASTINDPHWDRYSWFNNTDYEKTGSPFRSSYIKELYPNYLAPDNTGVTLTLHFTGNSFGFVGTLKEKCSLYFVLDGNDTKTVSGTTDTGKLEYPVFENLTNTNHTVTVKVTGQNRYAAIAAFVTTA